MDTDKPAMLAIQLLGTILSQYSEGYIHAYAYNCVNIVEHEDQYDGKLPLVTDKLSSVFGLPDIGYDHAFSSPEAVINGYLEATYAYSALSDDEGGNDEDYDVFRLGNSLRLSLEAFANDHSRYSVIIVVATMDIQTREVQPMIEMLREFERCPVSVVFLASSPSTKHWKNLRRVVSTAKRPVTELRTKDGHVDDASNEKNRRRFKSVGEHDEVKGGESEEEGEVFTFFFVDCCFIFYFFRNL